MSEQEFRDLNTEYTEVPILKSVLNILLWGTVFGGMAFALIFQITRAFILDPFFNLELPRGETLGIISFSFAFICSVGYSSYISFKEIERREDCQRRGLTLVKR
ncbi:hypothetical protein [Hyphococcus luteus]|uniref:hypothetical protein n=1 Tax=Hyphococcus luteus TaxID=2058213 RepID=UPI0010571591|nr:hypothetical protein [Marinicaulis flavus]